MIEQTRGNIDPRVARTRVERRSSRPRGADGGSIPRRWGAPSTLLLTVLALGACGGGGDGGGRVVGDESSGRPASGLGALAALAGLYDLTFSLDGERDVGYLEIRPDAVLVRHDYQQDDYGTGANCWISSAPVTPIALGDDRYAVTFDGETSELTLRRGDSGGLYIAEQRFETINGFAQPITVADEYPPVTGVAARDLVRCTA